MSLSPVTAARLRLLLAREGACVLSAKARERLEWVLYYVEQGQSVSETCRHFGITRAAFYRLLRRFDPDRPETLEDQSCRPHTVRSSVSPEAVAFIRAYREKTPCMGARRIASLLAIERTISLAPATVGRVIERECLYFGNTPLHLRKRMQHSFADASVPPQAPLAAPAFYARPRRHPALASAPAAPSAMPATPPPASGWLRARWSSIARTLLMASIIANIVFLSAFFTYAWMEGRTNAQTLRATTSTQSFSTPSSVSSSPLSFLQDLFTIQTAEAASGIYKPISYQGKITLTSGTAPSNGSYNMRFKVFSGSTLGSPLWTETWNGANKVTMTGGLFSIQLGSIKAMTGSVNFNTDNLYLQVEFDPSNAGTYPEVFSPRRRFTAVPYALNADKLDGLDSTQFVRTDSGSTITTGTLKILTPGVGLSVSGTLSGKTILANTSLASSGTLRVQGNALFRSTLTLGSVTYTFPTSDGSASGKVLKTNGAGILSWSTDLTGGGSSGFGTGNVVTIADGRYVNQSGDTMTGGLMIVNGGHTLTAIDAGLLLEVAGAMSGRIIHAQDTLSSSGNLVVKGTSLFQSGAVISRAANSEFLKLNDTTNNANVGIRTGVGNPNGTVTASRGSLFMASDTGKIWKNNDGATGWSELTAGSGSVHMAKLTRNAAQSIPSGGIATKIYFDTKEFDVGGIANVTPGSTGSGRITIQKAGRYLVNATIWLPNQLDGEQLVAYIFKNGSDYLESETIPGLATNTNVSIADVLDLKAGDFIEICVFQNSGSAQNTYTANQYKPRMSVIQLQDNGGSNLWTLSGSNLFSNNSGNVGIGSNVGSPGSKLSVSGAVIINNSGTLGRTAADAGLALEVIGTASGTRLFATNNLSSSGSLTVQNSVTFRSLTSCTALQTSSAGALSCGTGGNGFGSGNTITIGDSRYVNQSGDTMTGGLMIVNGGHTLTAIDAGLLLEVAGAMSGRIIHAQDTLSSSGNLVVKGTSLFQSGAVISRTANSEFIKLNDTTNNANVGIRTGVGNPNGTVTASRGSLFMASDTGKIWKNNDGATSWSELTAGSGSVHMAKMTSGVGQTISNTTITAIDFDAKTFDIGGIASTSTDKFTIKKAGRYLVTASWYTSTLIPNQSTIWAYIFKNGASVKAAQLLSAGSTNYYLEITDVLDLAVNDTIDFRVQQNTGGGVVVASTTGIQPMMSVIQLQDNGGSNLWTLSGSNLFSNNSGNVGIGNNVGSPGSKLSVSGAVIISNQGNLGRTSADANIALEIIGAASGRILHAQDTLSSSGTLVVKGVSTFENNINVRGNLSGAALTVMGGTSYLLGSVGIGTASPAFPLDLLGSNGSNFISRIQNMGNSTTAHGLAITAGSNSAGGASLLYFARPDGTALGSISEATATSVSFNATSDRRLKQNIVNSTGGLALLNQIQVRDYNFIADPQHQKMQGFIAQELNQIYPEAVTVGDNTLDGSGRLVHPWGVDYGKLTPLLVKSVQELAQKISALGSGNMLHASDLSLTGSLKVAKGALFSSGVVISSPTTLSGQNLFTVQSNVGGTDNAVLRITADGNAYSDGTFTGGGADYAEWFYASSSGLKPGEAVCVDVARQNTVARCSRSGDQNVIGIVSTKPAFIGNKFSGAENLHVPGTVLVGLIGQVPAKAVVEGSGGSIHPGDSLTTSSIPGFVRKAQSGESTVGVALEGLSAGQGTIQVLISRGNQSLTVSMVEDHVLQAIKDMNVEDQITALVAQASRNLSASGSLLAQSIQTQLTQELHSLDLTTKIRAVLKEMSGSFLHSSNNQTTTLTSSSSSLTLRKDLSVGGSASFSGTLATRGTLTADALVSEKTLMVAGDASIGGDLYLGGMLKVASLFVPGLVKIDGGLTVGSLSADSGSIKNLHIGSGSSLEGTINLNGTLNLSGSLHLSSGSTLTLSSLTVQSALHVLGNVTVEGLASFLSDVTVKGRLTVADQLILSARQAGEIAIPKSGTSAIVLFDPPFATKPIVTAASDDFIYSPWRVTRRTMTGFAIELASPAQNAVTFSWISVGVQAASGSSLSSSTSSASATASLLPFPVDSHGVPTTGNAIEDACLRDHTPLDQDGHPYDCNRYHLEHVWQFGTLTFEWNTLIDPPILTPPQGYAAVVQEIPPAPPSGGSGSTATGSRSPISDGRGTTGSGSTATGSGTAPSAGGTGSGARAAGGTISTTSGAGVTPPAGSLQPPTGSGALGAP